jgi:hypothetical protein
VGVGGDVCGRALRLTLVAPPSLAMQVLVGAVLGLVVGYLYASLYWHAHALQSPG